VAQVEVAFRWQALQTKGLDNVNNVNVVYVGTPGGLIVLKEARGDGRVSAPVASNFHGPTGPLIPFHKLERAAQRPLNGLIVEVLSRSERSCLSVQDRGRTLHPEVAFDSHLLHQDAR